MTHVDTEIRRMVDHDHPHPTPPDLDALTGAGRRRLRRRRLGTGVAAVAAAGALAVPAYLVAGGGDTTATDPATVPAPVPTATGDCGQLFCGDPRKESEPEKATLAGEPWVVGELADGTEEVIYAASARGVDLGTGKRRMIDALMIGYRDGGELHRVVWSVQPGAEGTSPDGDPVRFWTSRSLLGAGPGDEYLVVGFVEGTPDEITWSIPDGRNGPVDGTSTTVLDGYTAFYLTQPYPEGHEQPSGPGYERLDRLEDGTLVDQDGNVIREGEDGAVRLDGGGGDTFPPHLTIHTSDGWSCSLADCGSAG